MDKVGVLKLLKLWKKRLILPNNWRSLDWEQIKEANNG